MALQENISLRPYNTFGVDARARYFFSVTTPQRLRPVVEEAPGGSPLFVLGGGSNVLFTRDFEGLVLKNDIMGRAVIEDGPDMVRVRAGGCLLYTSDAADDLQPV